MKRTEGEVRRELADYGRRLYEKRLLTGLGGNISARIDDEAILISPSGVCKGDLRPSDLIRMLVADGKVTAGGRPSMETPFHLAFYRGREDVGAVVHAHPLFCTVLATANQNVRTDLTPEGLLLLGRVGLVPYATPGSAELAERLQERLRQHDAFILQSHGAITVGKDIADAYFKMETLEFLAELQVRTEGVNGAKPLSPDEAEKVLAMAQGHGSR